MPKQIGSQYRETLEEAGLTLLSLEGDEAILSDGAVSSLWIQNNHYSGYVVEIQGMGYEFTRSLVGSPAVREDTTMPDLEQFIAEQHIRLTAERTDDNPNMVDSGSMDHWKVTLRRPGKQMTTYFSMGYGHNGKTPTAADVLDCLANDASSVENAQGFEDWASDLGYDADSRTAEKTYRVCVKAANRLQAWLGYADFQTLLYNVERL